MKRIAGRTLFGLAILAVLLGHVLSDLGSGYRIGVVSHLDAIIYDAKLRLTMPQTRDERIVILDIDERALAEHGRWPWSRDKMAAIMDKLFGHYGVTVVGFDIVFAEPDLSSGIASLEKLSKAELRNNAQFQSALRGLRGELDFDGRFARSIKGRPVVLGYYLSNIEGGRSNGVLPPPTLGTEVFDQREIEFTSWTSHGGNLPILQNAAAGAGHFNPMVDFDGLSRRVPILASYQNGYYEALSVAVVRELIGAKTIKPGFTTDAAASYGGMEWVDLVTNSGGVLRVPVDANAAALVPFRGYRESFAYHSLGDVLTGALPKEALESRIVLIGTSAPGLMDLRATPVDTAYPGVEMHANMIAGMLDGTIKHKPSYVTAVDLLLVSLSGLAMIFVLPRLSPLRATLLTFLILLGVLTINLGLWHSQHFVVPLAAGLLAIALLYALNMSWGYFAESRIKRQITQLFGQYVPPELVDEMARNPEGYSMSGRRAELTVLFSDVRGFTTISEALQPEQLATLMNEYLGAMTQVIRGHRGTLDKYIGDAIMAFWGAPVADPRHAYNATLSAIQMQEGMRVLNQELSARGWPELKIGVGVNSGPMTVGDMGSTLRKAYTVMGDAVNLGSRLEGITKQYGVGVLVGEETWRMTRDDFVFRELDRVRVKGKIEPVGIYEPLGLHGAVSEVTMRQLSQWNEALMAYRAQDWARAERILEALEAEERHRLYELYRERICHCRANPPGADWDGVTTFDTK